MPSMPRAIGEFCWINVLTPDPQAEQPFFTAVLGWTFTPLPGVMGWLILADGAQVGVLFRNVSPTGESWPAGIGAMVRVADAEAGAARLRDLGARAGAPVAVGRGRMVDAADAGGALIDLWETTDDGTMLADPTTHGVPSWFELVTRAPDRAAGFYAACFGWTAVERPMPGFTYTMLLREGQGVAGIMPHQADMGDASEYWTVYMTVRDPDAAAAAAAALGGTVVVPPEDIPGVGRFAALRSPGGVFFHVIRYGAMGDGSATEGTSLP